VEKTTQKTEYSTTSQPLTDLKVDGGQKDYRRRLGGDRGLYRRRKSGGGKQELSPLSPDITEPPRAATHKNQTRQ